MFESLQSTQGRHLALIMGKALKGLFSQVQLLEYAAYEGQFYYEVVLSQPLAEEMLPIIQEEMLNLLDKQEEFYALEMIPKNAVELFTHQGQELRAQILKGEEAPILDLVRIGEHYDLVNGDFEEEFEGVFKITHFEQSGAYIGDEEVFSLRIFGVLAEDKKALKGLLQAQKEIRKLSHEKIALNQHLFKETDQGWLFLPRGARALNALKAQINQTFEKFGFEELHFSPYLEESFNGYFEAKSKSPQRAMTWIQNFSTQYSPFLYGIYNQEQETINQFKILLPTQKEVSEECIYCLKFYLEIIKILGFSYELDFLCGNEVSSFEGTLEDFEQVAQNCKAGSHLRIRLLDHWKRNLLSLELKFKQKGKEMLIEGSIPSLEKLIAWMLEDGLGELPSSLCAKEVQLLCLNGAQDYGRELYQYLKEHQVEARLDESDDKLETKLYRALKERQPYIAILGAKEKEKQTISLRQAGSKQQIELNREELLEKLRT